MAGFGYTGGYSPSTMPWSPPAKTKTKRSKAPKREKERERDEPQQRRVLGSSRLWNNAPAQKPAAAPRQAPAKRREVTGFDFTHFRDKHPAAEKPTQPMFYGSQQPGLSPGMGTALNDFVSQDDWTQKPVIEIGGGYAGPKLGPQQEKPRGSVPSGQSLIQQQRNDMSAMGVSQENLNALARGQGNPELVDVPGSQPGRAPANPNPVTPTVPLPELSDGVREMLNDQNWKLPKAGKRVGMPKSSYEKGSFEDLKDYNYNISAEEWDRIEATYSSPAALAAGYIPPSATGKAKTQKTPLMHSQENESAALNWTTYEDMSKGQRAAVDFNTVMLDRIEDDLDDPIKLSTAERLEYDKRVTKLFGEGRGSDTIAKNTVDLLTQLDMNVVGQDLDEYLSRERLIDDVELKDFKFSKGDIKTIDTLANAPEPVTGPEAYSLARSDQNMDVIDTVTIQNTQNLIKQKVADPDSLTYDFDTLMNGPSAAEKKEPPIGFGAPTQKWSNEKEQKLNDWVVWAWGVLSDDDPTKWGIQPGEDTMSRLLGDLDEMTHGDTAAKQTFVDFIQGRVDMAGQYGSPEEQAMVKKIAERSGVGG